MSFNELSQLGAVAIIFIFAIKEFFSYIKTIKQNGSNPGERLARLEEKVSEIKDNHLKHIIKWMESHEIEHKRDRELLIEITHKLKG